MKRGVDTIAKEQTKEQAKDDLVTGKRDQQEEEVTGIYGGWMIVQDVRKIRRQPPKESKRTEVTEKQSRGSTKAGTSRYAALEIEEISTEEEYHVNEDTSPLQKISNGITKKEGKKKGQVKQKVRAGNKGEIQGVLGCVNKIDIQSEKIIVEGGNKAEIRNAEKGQKSDQNVEKKGEKNADDVARAKKEEREKSNGANKEESQKGPEDNKERSPTETNGPCNVSLKNKKERNKEVGLVDEEMDQKPPDNQAIIRNVNLSDQRRQMGQDMEMDLVEVVQETCCPSINLGES